MTNPLDKLTTILARLMGKEPSDPDVLKAVVEVVMAMRTPSAWMIDEMCGVWARHPNDRRKLGEIMISYWQAGIDAALVDDSGNRETQAMIDALLGEG